MSTLTAPFRWMGRVLLWVLFFPLGIWRSVVNHSRKKERRRMKFEAEQRERDRQALQNRP
jgi:hypothetical protein